jgi:hypothetical protein
MGGYSSGSSGAPSGGGTSKQAKNYAKKNEPTVVDAIGDFIKGGGIVGGVTREITKRVEAKNKKSKSGDVYEGAAYGYNQAKEKKDYNPRSVLSNREGNNDRPTQKSLEQPKVASQMDNSEVKSDLIMADKTAPTDVEMTDDELLLKRKRGKKTRTILTSVTGDTSKATLSKKVLLG